MSQRQPQDWERMERLEQALTRVGDVAAGLELLSERAEQIVEILEADTEPARHERHTLSATTSRRTSNGRGPAMSIGIYNPNPITIYVGIDGPAREGVGTLSAPANSLLVLPLAIEDFEIGVKAADVAAGDAIVHIFRYATVQPAFLGAL